MSLFALCEWTAAEAFVASHAAVSIGSAAQAAADDPWDRTPVCTGHEIPATTACNTGGQQGTWLSRDLAEDRITTAGGPADERPPQSPGADPYVALGVGH
ncbi:MAG: hypothetical protein ACLPLP_22560 [Mycobacterium sp.]